MERLTEYEIIAGHVHALPTTDNAYEAIARLAAYEDTGLEPEEIEELSKREKIFYDVAKRYTDLGEYYHILELAKAEKDGRLVVLPCREDAELERDGHTFKADHWNHSLTAFRDAPETKSGKQVAIFSIEEAEAALAGKGGEE